MHYLINNDVAKVFKKANVLLCHVDGHEGINYSIHKSWLDKCVENGLVKEYSIVGDGAIVEFTKHNELYNFYKKTIKNENNRGVIISYNFATDDFRLKGYDGWCLDVNEDLKGKYFNDYLSAMNHIRIRKECIKLRVKGIMF